VRGDHRKAVKALIQSGDDPNSPKNLTADGGPVIAAVKIGDVELVRLLLEGRVAKNLTDSYGKTALDYAKAQHRVDMQELLTTDLPYRR
jgi:ankyrin repeat protein